MAAPGDPPVVGDGSCGAILAVVTTAGGLGLRRINERQLAGRPIWLLVLAAIGGALLVIVATTRWAVPSDEHAYWLAARRIIDGLPLYDPAATIITPYAYLYPPPLAQAMVPVALILPSWAFSALWTVGMGVALWWLAGRDVIRALALIAFLPIAVEFWYRNVHLFLAVLIVLGLRGHPWAMSVGAAIKVSPGLGLVWFAGRGRWRDATIMLVSGLAILVVSVVLAPDQWLAWIDYLRAQDPFAQSAFFGVPFPIRAVVALALTVIASSHRRVAWRGPARRRDHAGPTVPVVHRPEPPRRRRPAVPGAHPGRHGRDDGPSRRRSGRRHRGWPGWSRAGHRARGAGRGSSRTRAARRALTARRPPRGRSTRSGAGSPPGRAAPATA